MKHVLISGGSRGIGAALVRGLAESGDRVSFAFQGGEPTLAGLDYFEYFVSQTEKWEGIRVSYALQTNGILLDSAWCAFLKKR